LNQLVAFSLEGQGYAVRLANAVRVLRMVEVTPMPKSPEVILGVLDIEGMILPVFSMRRRFGLLEREASLTDQLLVVNTAPRAVALVVNAVAGVVEKSDDEITQATEVGPGARHIEGVTRLEDGLLFIYDLNRFLSPSEEVKLQRALAKARSTV
jgi:purine-binding chemotaxis protein CheW